MAWTNWKTRINNALPDFKRAFFGNLIYDPARYIVENSVYTRSGGLAASFDVTVTGMLATDSVLVCPMDTTNTPSVINVVPAAGKFTVTFSAQIADDDTISYIVSRAWA